jgi:hypothetical protein
MNGKVNIFDCMILNSSMDEIRIFRGMLIFNLIIELSWSIYTEISTKHG